MSIQNGAMLRDEDAERRSEAARALGSAKTERKAAASRSNGLKGGAYPMTEETKAKLRESQRLRREREKEERIALGLDAAADTEKKPVGRPRKQTEGDAHISKRPRGRPKKNDSPNAIDAPENGA